MRQVARDDRPARNTAPPEGPPARRVGDCARGAPRSWRWRPRPLSGPGPARAGQVRLGILAEGCDEAAMVAGAGSKRDVAWLDPLQGNRGEVGTHAADGDAGRDDGHSLPAGYQLDLVLDSPDEGTVGRGAA